MGVGPTGSIRMLAVSGSALAVLCLLWWALWRPVPEGSDGTQGDYRSGPAPLPQVPASGPIALAVLALCQKRAVGRGRDMTEGFGT